MSKPRRHWADRPVGTHADRVWRSLPQPPARTDEEESYSPSLPPSPLQRAADSVPFKPYVYGRSPKKLRPEIVDSVVETDLKKQELEEKREQKRRRLAARRRPSKTPKPDLKPETFVPPELPEEPEDGLERENRDLRAELKRLRSAVLQTSKYDSSTRAVPLYVKPFVCSACDPQGAFFTYDHWRCTGADCVCYGSYPEMHDQNRRLRS